MVEITGLVAELSRFGTLVVIWAILAFALNLQWGQTGLFNAGIAGFWALGAYVGALVVTDPVPRAIGYPGHWGIGADAFPAVFGVSSGFLVATIFAGLASALLAFFIAIPALRLRADYLAIATLALAQITTVSLKNVRGVTGGVFGIPFISRPFEFGAETHFTELSYFLLLAGLLVAAFFFLERMVRSPWGRALRAVREDEDAAQALGKDTFLLKLQAFVLGAAMMGVAGALFAFFLRTLASPEVQFTALDTFQVFVIVMIGGVGNNRGVLVGTFVILFLEFFTVRAKDWFLLSPDFASQIFYLRLLVIGLILILLVLFRPQGLLPEPKHVAKKPRWLLR